MIPIYLAHWDVKNVYPTIFIFLPDFGRILLHYQSQKFWKAWKATLFSLATLGISKVALEISPDRCI